MKDTRITRRMNDAGGPLGYFKTGFENLFDDLFKTFDIEPFGWPAKMRSDFVPRLDIEEHEKEYVASLELPGMEKKDVDLNISDKMLTITGEKRSEHKEEKGKCCYGERSYGHFSRSLRLPEDVEEDKIKAEFKDGVLKVTLPRSEPVKPEVHKIEIK